MTKPSHYWAELEQEAAEFTAADLARFREGGGLNDRFAAWNPKKRGLTFFKFFLQRLLAAQGEPFFTAYRRLGRTDLGNPPAIPYRHQGETLSVDYEYFMAIEEYLFLKAGMGGQQIETMCEIGAGFGRTCHAFLRTMPEIKTYAIIDLPNIMRFSGAYLKAVLTPDEFKKVAFVDATTIAPGARLPYDLALASNSLQSLEEAIVRRYLDLIAANVDWFYLRDAVAKYRPQDLVGDVAPVSASPASNAAPAAAAIALGLCRQVIDVFDPAQIEPARVTFVGAYTPSPDFAVAASRAVEAIPFYQHVLYRRAPRR